MNYKTYADLVRDSRALIRKLPADTAAVLAIPRSGLLPATIIAQELGVELGTVEGYGGYAETFESGPRLTPILQELAERTGGEGTIVVVDDSVYMGSAMRTAREMLRRRCPDEKFFYAAVYAAPTGEKELDAAEAVVAMPRLFEWNWMHHSIIGQAMVDLDGILCRDPHVFDDDGPMYVACLAEAAPLWLPRRKIGTIVTGRLERWRSVTQGWLARHGVTFDRLVMAPFDTAAARRRYNVAGWKSEVYRSRIDVPLFIESNMTDAEIIHRTTGRPVLCPTTGHMFS